MTNLCRSLRLALPTLSTDPSCRAKNLSAPATAATNRSAAVRGAEGPGCITCGYNGLALHLFASVWFRFLMRVFWVPSHACSRGSLHQCFEFVLCCPYAPQCRRASVMKRMLLGTLLALAASSALAAPTLQRSNFTVSRDWRVVAVQLYCVVGGGLCWNSDTRLALRQPGPANRPRQGRAARRACPNGWICRYR